MQATHLYHLLEHTAERLPTKISFRRRQKDGQLVGRSFRELKNLVDCLTTGLVDAGVSPGEKITFLCDASTNWLATDLAIISSGAVSVPRGTDVTDDDIAYIVEHSGSEIAMVQTEAVRQRLQKLDLPALKRVFVMEDKEGNLAEGSDSLSELITYGRELLKKKPNTLRQRLTEVAPGELATLIYTSGTTGAPKGVMLDQTCWLTAIAAAGASGVIRGDDSSVSLLPPWHAFERLIEYVVLAVGADFVVSNISHFRDDLRDFKPTILPSVPRIWESVYQGIIDKMKKESPLKQQVFHFFLEIGEQWAKNQAILQGYAPHLEKDPLLLDLGNRLLALLTLIALSPLKLAANQVFAPIHQGLGGRLSRSISGGSALPEVVDRFLTALGIKVLEGYGMTETAGVTSVRDFDEPTAGTVGRPITGYQLRLKDENGRQLSLSQPGAKGTLWVKSPQVFKGYYKRDELNKELFDADGFFNTGDLMMFNYRGELKFAGRSKDTIALAGGENIEPSPIEDKLLSSSFVDQVMVVGDDQKTLGALVVPNFDAVREALNGIPTDPNDWNDSSEVRALFRKEIGERINQKQGFKSFEVVPKNCFYVVPRQFDPDREMTRTFKVRRLAVKDSFAEQIKELFQ